MICEHEPEVILPAVPFKSDVCRWVFWDEPIWLCRHVKMCVLCGVEFEYRTQCPIYKIKFEF